MVHLVYCDDKEKVLEKILTGSKTMIIRSAAGRKIPHSRVFAKEILYFMKKGSMLISAKATVTDVQNYVKLSEEEIVRILNENQPQLQLSLKQQERWHKKCICLVSFKDVTQINPALHFEKQNNMDDWLILNQIEDVLVGTSIPYNYDNAKF